MEKNKTRFWNEGIGSFVVAILIALTIRWAFMEAYVIPSGSMLPTLLVNDHIFVNKAVYGVRVPFTTDWLLRLSEPRRGDVIVFRYPSDPNLYYIKRVIGVPGDSILYENGNLYVNQELVEKEVPKGRTLREWSWLKDRDFVGELNAGGLSNYSHWQESLGEKVYSILLKQDGTQQLEFGPYAPVPEGHYFVMGDNRDNSQDSRFWASLSSVAKGRVTLEKIKKDEGELTIESGTLLATKPVEGRSVRYKTLESVKLGVGPREVAVECVEPGPAGNVGPGEIKIFEDQKLQAAVKVYNAAPVLGGQDKKYVPREYVVGRAMFVWLSCEERLPVVDFLCNPLSIRWGRLFHSVK